MKAVIREFVRFILMEFKYSKLEFPRHEEYQLAKIILFFF